MKILAPLRNSGEVADLCAAGAHEFYCGTTPPGWEEAFGTAAVHRRSAKAAGVPDLGDLRRIVALAGDRPVFATLNAPSYPAGAVPFLVDFGLRLLDDVGIAACLLALAYFSQIAVLIAAAVVLLAAAAGRRSSASSPNPTISPSSSSPKSPPRKDT